VAWRAAAITREVFLGETAGGTTGEGGGGYRMCDCSLGAGTTGEARRDGVVELYEREQSSPQIVLAATASIAGMRRPRTSRVMATAKMPPLRAARRSTL
jgi:hypothetical protein